MLTLPISFSHPLCSPFAPLELHRCSPDSSLISDSTLRSVCDRFLGVGETVFDTIQGTAVTSSYFKRDGKESRWDKRANCNRSSQRQEVVKVLRRWLILVQEFAHSRINVHNIRLFISGSHIPSISICTSTFNRISLVVPFSSTPLTIILSILSISLNCTICLETIKFYHIEP